MNRVPLALLLVLLPACPSPAPSACEASPQRTSDCCCFTSDPDIVLIENSCPAVESCPPLVIKCSGDDPECPVPDGFGGGTPGAFEVDEAGLDCVLQALRDGTPGTLEWTFQDHVNSGQYQREVTQHVAADRVVYATAIDTEDQAGSIDDATQQVLQPPAYFEGCLEEPDLRARALCLTATTTGSITATCAVGGSYSNF